MAAQQTAAWRSACAPAAGCSASQVAEQLCLPLPADAPSDLLGATRGFMVAQDTGMRQWPRSNLLLALSLRARGCLRRFTQRGTAVPAAPS